MRTRLSAQFSIWFKVLSSLFLFLFSFILLRQLWHYPWPVWVNLSFEAILAITSYSLVQYFFKDRTVISFDQDNLYITDVNLHTEQVVPLDRVSFLNMRMNSIETGKNPEFRYKNWSWTFDVKD